MTYRAPLAEILLAVTEAAEPDGVLAQDVHADLADGFAEATLAEAARFAETVLAPLNRAGDQDGAKLESGEVRTTPGWAAAYKQWSKGGWSTITAPVEVGGMGLPFLLDAACIEIWNAANMAFGLCPLLTLAAVDAMQAHASEALKARYLRKLVTGEWTGTMNLTEPQAGSDLSTLRTRAEKQADASYKIFGTKIFITYGEHDMAENIVHFVLARIPGAPEGTRGLSLFLVPKLLVAADGSLGARNDVRCVSLEHKLGIHGSPTCTMAYGDEDGAIGYLVGEESKGLAAMFTMMNNARLNVGVQGVGIAERAFQQALAYAHERHQGRSRPGTGDDPCPIVEHPDVRRMLMTMKALIAAARSICYMAAAAVDGAHRAADPTARGMAAERAALLTPVAKAFATDIANEVASLGVQVHGGAGFIEETGAAQFVRDARIAAIYEGTNGIQAIDLATRKLGLSNGAPIRREIADMRNVLDTLQATNAEGFGEMEGRLFEAVEAFERATSFMHDATKTAPEDALAGATPYLRLFALARGGTALARGALAARRALEKGASDPRLATRILTARFFADHVASGATGLELSVTRGASSVHAGALALAL
jgi:acyl-CoA dehydrogenase